MKGLNMLKIEDLEKQVNQGIAKGIYLLYGEETFLLEQQVAKMKKNFGTVLNARILKYPVAIPFSFLPKTRAKTRLGYGGPPGSTHFPTPI